MKKTLSLLTISLLTLTISAQWIQKGTDIDGEAAADESGLSVSMSSDGNTLAIGARWNDGAGHVRIYEFLSVGLFENDFGEELLMYPNPTAGDFTIELGDNYESTILTLMEMNGKTIRSINPNNSPYRQISGCKALYLS